ncbi:MAG: hypothetical protein Q7R45_16410 [Sulfuricaulis sp.]|nr:hypothetical protein [Sulfuricaulis sp.]
MHQINDTAKTGRRGFSSSLAAAIAVLVMVAVLAGATSQSHVTQGESRDVQSAVDAQYLQDYSRTLLEDAMRDMAVDTAWQACDCRRAFPGNPNGINLNTSMYANVTPYLNAATVAFNKSFFSTNYTGLDLGGTPSTFTFSDRYGQGNFTYCNGTGSFNVSLTAWSNTTSVHAMQNTSRTIVYNLTRNEETPANLEVQVRIQNGLTTVSRRTVRFTC